MLGCLTSRYDRVIHLGVDSSTPSHLVDRVVYSNWVYLAATVANVPAAISNLVDGYHLVFTLNVVYQATALASWLLNARHRHLASRLAFLGVVHAGLLVACLVQGTVVQMEHYFLATGALGISMFHPSERRWGAAFAAVSAIAYLALVDRARPIVVLDGEQLRYAAKVLFLNQLTYTGLLLCSLLGIMNAYGRATKIVDDQRARLFEHSRLSALGSVACNVAHEINTPLMAMDIHLDSLDERLADDPARAADHQAVQALGELSRRIAMIVAGFKRLSYSDSNDRVADTTVGALVHAALDITAGRLKPLGIALEVALDAPDHPVRCRIVALSQALLTLINNSVDAVAELPAPARWIRVAASTRGGRLQLRVTDAGRIESASVRQRLFEAFFTTKPIGKGTGLGLSLSRQTVEQHGGRLAFDPSSPHTSFVLELPGHAAEPGAAASAPVAEARAA